MVVSAAGWVTREVKGSGWFLVLREHLGVRNLLMIVRKEPPWKLRLGARLLRPELAWKLRLRELLLRLGEELIREHKK